MAKTRTRDKVGQDTCLCHFVFLFLFSPRRMMEPAQMGTARSEREFREEGEEGWRGRSWQQDARFCSAGPRLLATRPHSPESLSPPQSLDRGRKKGSWEERRGLQRSRRDRGALGEAETAQGHCSGVAGWQSSCGGRGTIPAYMLVYILPLLPRGTIPAYILVYIPHPHPPAAS